MTLGGGSWHFVSLVKFLTWDFISCCRSIGVFVIGFCFCKLACLLAFWWGEPPASYLRVPHKLSQTGRNPAGLRSKPSSYATLLFSRRLMRGTAGSWCSPFPAKGAEMLLTACLLLWRAAGLCLAKSEDTDSHPVRAKP